MALLVVGFCWAHKVGEWRATHKPIPFYKHRENIRPQHSYFRYGLDWIRETLLFFSENSMNLMLCIKYFTPQNVSNLMGKS
jgi:hypothetical protein